MGGEHMLVEGLFNQGMGVQSEGVSIYHEGWYSGIVYLTTQFIPDEKPKSKMEQEVEEEIPEEEMNNTVDKRLKKAESIDEDILDDSIKDLTKFSPPKPAEPPKIKELVIIQ